MEWPTRLPDLNHLGFPFRGLIKSKIFVRQSENLYELLAWKSIEENLYI